MSLASWGGTLQERAPYPITEGPCWRDHGGDRVCFAFASGGLYKASVSPMAFAFDYSLQVFRPLPVKIRSGCVRALQSTFLAQGHL